MPPSPPWGRRGPAAGAFTSRSGPGEGVSNLFKFAYISERLQTRPAPSSSPEVA